MKVRGKVLWGALAIVTVLGVTIPAFSRFYSQHNSASGTTISSSTNQVARDHGQCLPSNKEAAYVLTKGNRAPNIANVTITDKISGAQISRFEISDVLASVHHYEIRACGIYVLRLFDYDYVRGIALPTSRIEVWKYDYTGIGKKLTEAEEFRVSPDESKAAFLHSSGDPSNPSGIVQTLSFENLGSYEIAFEITLSGIAKGYPAISGELNFDPGGWSSDSRYFWLDTFDAADVFDFIRVDAANWSYQVFPAPTTTMGGDAFNPDTGMVTYRTNAAPWTADSAIDQQYRDAAAQSGQISSFNIYDFLTNKIYLVATTTDPTYYYQPHWISDSMLGYTLLSGATTTYTITP